MNYQSNQQLIYVGMSGGVDSSVTAALLKDQGYSVVGVYMKNWTRSVAGVECSWRDDVTDAMSVAARLDIPFKIFDFQREYKHKVVKYMLDEYRAGRTPNPDIMCNQEVKFKLFLDAALADGADGIATGHYAQVIAGGLYAGLDKNKDQSYFLYRITAEAVRRSRMPLGNLHKPEVRKLALKYKLPNAKKPDSQGICFIGEVSIPEFLSEYIASAPGLVRHQVSQKVLGDHEGAIFYTIGQRHGFGGGGGLPLYVSAKDMDTNTVYVTEDRQTLMSQNFTIDNLHWIISEPIPTHNYLVRLRHRGDLIPARLSLAENMARVELEHAERAITPGQSAVVYQEDKLGLRVLGGGIISQVY